MVSESRVTWATSVPILVFLGLSDLDLGPMHATDRQTDVRVRRHTDVRRASSLNAPALGAGIIMELAKRKCITVLLYILERYSLTVADVKSLDFTVIRFLLTYIV